MIDNLNRLYSYLHDLPEGLKDVEALIASLSGHDATLTRRASKVPLTKANVYKYYFVTLGFGVSMDIRVMNGPFAVQNLKLLMGCKKYETVIIGSKATLKDYTYPDKAEVEDLVSKITRLITDITLSYEGEV